MTLPNCTNQQPPAASAATRLTHATPDVDIVETGAAYLLEVDLPGVEESSIQANLERGYLTLRAEVRPEAPAGLRPLHLEFGPARYERVFNLTDAEVDADHIQARYRQGVLTLTLPKAASQRARRIEIRG